MSLSIDTAALCAELCARSYMMVPNVSELGLSLAGRIDTPYDAYRGFVARTADGKRAYVVFRGSRGIKDWMADADAVPAEWSAGESLQAPAIARLGCKLTGLVHGGFLRLHGLAWPDTSRILDDLVAADGRGVREVVFTGHSLGGALAYLAAMAAYMRFWHPAFPTLATYTFGAPRTADASIAAAYGAEVPDTLRVVFEQDPVPRIEYGYGVHFGHHLALDRRGRVPSAPAGWWNSLRAWVQTRAEDATLTSAPDHHIDNYVQATRLAAAAKLPPP